jgi:uncharacterized membrane protein YraQ (UPF0718 family)
VALGPSPRRNPPAIGQLKGFLAGLSREGFLPEKYRIKEAGDAELIERLVAIERSIQDATVRRDVLQHEAAARLHLLSRITWIAVSIVGVNLVLLIAVVLASVYTTYHPDEWFVRILAGGSLASIIAMLGAIVAHYWPGREAGVTPPPSAHDSTPGPRQSAAG